MNEVTYGTRSFELLWDKGMPLIIFPSNSKLPGLSQIFLPPEFKEPGRYSDGALNVKIRLLLSK
jgi:hypothetical protein